MPRLTTSTRNSWSRVVPRAGGALAALLAAGLLLAGPATRVSAAPAPPVPAVTAAPVHARAAYYLALGDSLAQGVQPATPPLPPGTTLGQSIETDQGYADDLYAHYRRGFPGSLTLVKLGCPGETTTSMLTGAGSPCGYPQGSQLAAALAFIAAHRSAITLITIDIGANNIDGCATATAISASCVAQGLAAVRHDLPLILAPLRRAAGRHAVIAGMNLYDPFLAAYLTGPAGQSVARQSVTLDQSLNRLLDGGYRAFGLRIADVQDAFSTTDFTGTAPLPGGGTVPVNVARVCDWTWMCAAAPVGPNIHPNATGYQVIACAFERAVGRLVRRGRLPGGRLVRHDPVQGAPPGPGQGRVALGVVPGQAHRLLEGPGLAPRPFQVEGGVTVIASSSSCIRIGRASRTAPATATGLILAAAGRS